MFDHLDDPQPFVADDDLRAAVVRRGRIRRRHAHVRNLAIESAAVLLLFVVAFGSYVRWQATRIDRVAIAAIPQVDPQGNPVAPNVGALDRPFTILVLGNDNAPGLDGRLETNLTDTMMLLRIDRPSGTVRVVSIPRDLWVPIDGHGTDRINTASQYGIPTVITTVNRVFGVTIDHYAELHFDGFERLRRGLPMHFGRRERFGGRGPERPAAVLGDLDGDRLVAGGVQMLEDGCRRRDRDLVFS